MNINLPSATLDLISHSADCTRRLGYRLGRRLRGGDIVLLSGDLGAGKTTFTQGLAAALGIEGPVQSPTFTLINEYHGWLEGDQPTDRQPVVLFHIDLYRLVGPELNALDLDDYLGAPDGIAVVEWPQRLVDNLPATAIIVEFVLLDETKRRLTLRLLDPADERYTADLASLRQELFGANAR